MHFFGTVIVQIGEVGGSENNNLSRKSVALIKKKSIAEADAES